MDPTRTWLDLAAAVQTNDWESAEEHARNLLDWLRKGGYPPEITAQPHFDRIVAVKICETILE
jgi:hypothetical protein